MFRPIITIDEEKCNGCGQCITDCAEGALAIVDGKAKLISQSYCDGLGACLNCPQGALKLETRDVPAFDEKAAMEALAKRDKPSGCAGGAPRELRPLAPLNSASSDPSLNSELRTWPIQLELMPVKAPWLENANLLLAAHCSGFAISNVNRDWIKDRIPVIACPKLEDNAKLVDKLSAIIRDNNIKSITVLRMSVPCCGGLTGIARKSIELAGKDVPLDIQIVQLP